MKRQSFKGKINRFPFQILMNVQEVLKSVVMEHVSHSGSFRCSCNHGLQETPNGDCYDIDECRMLMGICRNGRCVNTIGSFICKCRTGYRLTDDERSCRDINECVEIPNMCLNGVCRNFDGSVQCTCNDGFRLAPSQKECIDVNECQEIPELCQNGECINTEGGFICNCPPGFQLVNHNRECQDIRHGNCYEKFERGRCLSPRPINQTKSECCCSQGAAWGYQICEVCPDPSEELQCTVP